MVPGGLHNRLMNYPDDIDVVWLACDRDGQVAAFVTGGCAPIPRAVLETPGWDEAESSCIGLTELCDAQSLLRNGDPGSFLSIARRGLHVYDWQDVHRVRSDESHAYELVAKPDAPCHFEDLPEPLARLALTFRFDASAFAQSPAIDPRTVAPCEQGRLC